MPPEVSIAVVAVVTPEVAGWAPGTEPSVPPAGSDAPGPDGTGPGGSPSRARWFLRPLAIYLVSRVVTWATLAVCAVVTHRSLVDEVDRWDSRWFLRVAATGWPTQLPHRHGHVASNTIAFFPLFPLSIRWLSHLTGLSLLAAGLAVTAVTGLAATTGVWLLVRHYADRAAADRATLLVAVFPGAFVLSLVYSEGLVVTCLAFGLLALMTRRWLLAGLLGLLATATAPIALAFEVSCLWCAYCQLADHREWRALAAPVLAPLGFVGYQLWLWIHTGNLFAWRLTEVGGWDSYPSLAYPVQTVVAVLRDPVGATKTDDLLVAGVALAVLGCVVAIRQRMPRPMLVYGVAAAVLALVAAPVGLRPRFLFLAFPLIVAVGTWLRGKAYTAALAICVAMLVGLTAFEVSSFQVFP
jgi:hypothetical protein